MRIFFFLASAIRVVHGSSSIFAYDGDLTACYVPDSTTKESQKPYVYTYMNYLATERGYAEKKRLLYVAATRAQDTLIFSGKESSGQNWMTWLDDPIMAEKTIVH